MFARLQGCQYKVAGFLGIESSASLWVDNARTTAAELQFVDYLELLALIETGRFEKNWPA